MTQYLPRHVVETVVHALVMSILDNGNALLFGLGPKQLIQKLHADQFVQNSATHLIVDSIGSMLT